MIRIPFFKTNVCIIFLKSVKKFGLQKYGVTTERDDLSYRDWLIHAQEEAMDLAVYLQRLINDIPDIRKKVKQ